MVLQGLQSLLKRLYDVDLGYDVCDFLVTDRRELHGVSPVNDGRAPDEELLLAQTTDGAGVSLYIDKWCPTGTVHISASAAPTVVSQGFSAIGNIPNMAV